MIKHVMIVEKAGSRYEVIVSVEDRLIVHQCARRAAGNSTGLSKMLGGLIQGKVVKRMPLEKETATK